MAELTEGLHPVTSICFGLKDAGYRATYGAVAEMVRDFPMFVMRGLPRDPIHSWVVSKSTGEPTAYEPEQIDPDIYAESRILATARMIESKVDPVWLPEA